MLWRCLHEALIMLLPHRPLVCHVGKSRVVYPQGIKYDTGRLQWQEYRFPYLCVYEEVPHQGHGLLQRLLLRRTEGAYLLLLLLQWRRSSHHEARNLVVQAVEGLHSWRGRGREMAPQTGPLVWIPLDGFRWTIIVNLENLTVICESAKSLSCWKNAPFLFKSRRSEVDHKKSQR